MEVCLHGVHRDNLLLPQIRQSLRWAEKKRNFRSYTCFEELVLIKSLRAYVTSNAGGLARLLNLRRMLLPVLMEMSNGTLTIPTIAVDDTILNHYLFHVFI